MNKTLEFIFDFSSPHAYMAYHALPPVLEKTGATLRIIPCLLAGIFNETGNQPPMAAYGSVKGKMDYVYLEASRFIRKHGLRNFRMNPHFPVDTLLMMRGAIVADMEGYLPEYVDEGLKQVWEQGLQVADPAVFAAALSAAGFDGPAILDKTGDSGVKEKLKANTVEAADRGVFGIPTFFVGREMFFGKERLGQVEEELLKAV